MILKDMKDFKYAGNDIQKIMYKENVLWERSGFSDIKELYSISSHGVPAATLIGKYIYIFVIVPDMFRKYKFYKLDTTNDQLSLVEEINDINNVAYSDGLYATTSDGVIYLQISDKTNALYSYNNSKWTKLTDIPDNYSSLYNGICSFNNNIHFFNNNNHIVYDIESNSFNISDTTPINFHMENPIVYNNKIHVFGGNIDSSNYKQYRYHYTWDGFGWKFIGEFTKPMVDVIYNGYVNFWSFEPTPVIFKNELYIIDYNINRGYITKYIGQNNNMYELVKVNDKNGIFNSSMGGRKVVISTDDAIYIIAKNTNSGNNVNIVKMK